MFYRKLCEMKIVDLFKTNNFAFLRFFVFQILLLKKMNFGLIIHLFCTNIHNLLQLLTQLFKHYWSIKTSNL